MAKELGEYNVDKILRELTAKQFAGWEHYFQLEPFGETRADYRAALIAKTVADVNRGSRAPYDIEDFRLNFEEQSSGRRTQTPEEQLAIARMIAASYSASDKSM